MHVVGVLLVVLGIGWPVLVVPCMVVWHFLLGEGPGHTRRKAARMPLWTCEQLNSAGSLPRRVAVTGVTAPGLHGLLRAPVSGEDCVWYESAVINDFSVNESPHHWACRLAPESFVAVADGPARVFLNIPLITNHFSISETIVRPGMEIFVIGKPSRKPGVGIVLKVRPISGVSSLPAADVHRYLDSRATRSLRLIGISFVAGLALIPIGDLLTRIF